jgi:hypothetical protein
METTSVASRARIAVVGFDRQRFHDARDEHWFGHDLPAGDRQGDVAQREIREPVRREHFAGHGFKRAQHGDIRNAAFAQTQQKRHRRLRRGAARMRLRAERQRDLFAFAVASAHQNAFE